MEKSSLIPYLFYQLIEDMGGVVDFDAKRVLDSIKSKEEKGVALSIAEGILRVELVEKDEVE